MSVAIVGASVAGMRTAQALRRQGYEDSITLIDAEQYRPYDKPPLSKEMLLPGGGAEPVPLVAEAELNALALELHLGEMAEALDPVRRVLTTSAGRRAYEHLVIATGSVPRTLPGCDDLAGVFTLRTAGDAAGLHAALRTSRRAVVVGAGFIGAEFASAARAHGVRVTIVEVMAAPMAHILGPEVGAVLARIHAVNGVELLCGEGVTGFEGVGRVTGVRLADGRVLPADVVVVGIGARPRTDWLAGSGLPVADGIACDTDLGVQGWPGVYAVGDVARFRHPLYDDHVRIEHWTNANEHAAIAAAGIVGKAPPAHQVPYVWSVQYGRRIQIVGRPSLGHPALVDGGVDEPSLVAVYASADGTVVGALTLDDPRTMMRCRKAILKRQTVEALGSGALSQPARGEVGWR